MNLLGMGPMELLLIVVLALIVFGPKKLPELGKGLGEAIRGFKKAMEEETTAPPQLSSSRTKEEEAKSNK